ncbi:methylated-DNA--[protein]-cysteine S-methyltransferase [Cryobacterium psychrophilum]|uniref:methylated-DNA--[protein]-cysteine S-methyltransferase n=1 Tax=Cryobacterium psychrophilum TaxID=41988 RepID=A0A4Y8KMV2_9MICO|nr:methylated-DNA--[protein]-cysteine S-methyltransferase [Cryobacterium psychrophilum]TDW29159.1 methylated-DNA-[protein]-cysteine S-methyltransferase [Cryobacterium psychrophilum]TFD77820.1 methylated-DNA--[protein]-cysteine S-methyltransferase [Cryobacterium psychrophilum]
MTTSDTSLIRVASPIGRLEITADATGIVSLSVEREGMLPLESMAESPSPMLRMAAAQLGEYFAGTRTAFDLPVRLTGGTVFQQRVWRGLQGLRFGEVISYGDLGAAIGRPGSGRAIGGAVGANPVPIIIACHRVLASTGRITGYSVGAGIPTKAWLLGLEGIAHTV